MAEKNYGNDSQLAEIVKYISDNMKVPVLGAGGGFAPIGTINSYMGTVAPQGWLVCDGQTYNITDYPDLATHIASQLGSVDFFGGDGTTTFAVPDLRGEFLRGSGTNSHTNQGSGEDVGEHQDGTEHLNIFYNKDGGSYFMIPGTKAQHTSLLIKNENVDGEIDGNRTANTFCNTSDGVVTYDNNYEKYTSRPTNTSVLFIIKATLSDTELNNMHVYSPNEHQVGWWQEVVDGTLKQKPVYEKRYDASTVSQGTIIGNIANLQKIIDASGHWRLGESGNQFSIPYGYNGSEDVSFYINSANNDITVNTNVNGIQDYSLTIRYTKTTDQWQTV